MLSLKKIAMKIEQIYTGCLAQGAYYIESNGEAAIIDPLREVDTYIEREQKDDAKIKYIFETHFHADFVSGHVTLSKATGAPIVFGPTAEPQFEAIVAEDGQEFSIGDLSLTALHTPGHTMESTTYLLKDENGQEIAIFTGDTLFLGDVGRPDLAQKAANLTQEELAATLYHSLRDKIMTLPDNITVYPGHGAGSACGKKISTDTVDTLGNQKATNYALRADMTEEEFVKEVTDGLAPPPQYFPMNVAMNKGGYEDIDKVLQRGLTPLEPKQFLATANQEEALILDVRAAGDFSKAYVPQSIFIGLDGDFAPWVGALIKDVQQNILLVVDEGREEEAVTRLARVGFDNTLGYLKGGVQAWQDQGYDIDHVVNISASDLSRLYHVNPDIPIFDVRKPSEFDAQHIVTAKNTPLATLNEYLDVFPKTTPFYVHCAGGYRSLIAVSILKSRGYHNAVNVLGGFKAIEQTDIPLTHYVCPTTML